MKSIVKFSLIAALIASTSVYAEMSTDDLATFSDLESEVATLTAAVAGSTSAGAVIVQGAAVEGATAMIIQGSADNLAIIQQTVSGFASIDQSNATASKALVVQKAGQ